MTQFVEGPYVKANKYHYPSETLALCGRSVQLLRGCDVRKPTRGFASLEGRRCSASILILSSLSA